MQYGMENYKAILSVFFHCIGQFCYCLQQQIMKMRFLPPPHINNQQFCEQCKRMS